MGLLATKVDPPRAEKHEPTVLTSEQARSLLQVVSGHRWEALFSIVIALGLRQGEALALRWQDVDFEAKSLRVRQSLTCIGGKFFVGDTKTLRSRRTLPLPNVCSSALLRHQAK